MEEKEFEVYCEDEGWEEEEEMTDSGVDNLQFGKAFISILGSK